MSLGVRLGTAWALGLGNLARVLSYRLLLRTGLHPVQRLGPVAPATGAFFRPPARVRTEPVPAAWWTTGSYFGWFRPPVGPEPPDWHRNPLDGRRSAAADLPWWTIPDFDPTAGDIKAIWEASRFDWVVAFAQRAATGEPGALQRLNLWLGDWCGRNPPYLGPNWKCGQEASIRVMHLALGALVLDQVEDAEPQLRRLVGQHLRRIRPTVAYARGQANNHGTSEAAALLLGGSWLAAGGDPAGQPWAQTGRELLEERVCHLVAADGSFSQHSVTYHRLLLDTLALTEVWRRRLGLAAFSPDLLRRAALASRWLRTLVDPASGDAPNLGANDSANLMPLTDADSRDFRPSVEVAASLFEARCAYHPPAWPAQLRWLDITPGDALADRPVTAVFPDGGLMVIGNGRARAMLRFPRFRFRPSHADALHLDLWVGQENLLRDGGSYSYAADGRWQDYFGGGPGHNTIQFDSRDQMPRLGRFLWGDWLTTERLDPVETNDTGVETGASYRDRWGARHQRRLRLAAESLEVTDRIEGFRTRAVLRWRLRPGAWRLAGTTVSDGTVRLDISSNVTMTRVELVQGWESRHYLEKCPIPVLEIEVAEAGLLTTCCRWGA